MKREGSGRFAAFVLAIQIRRGHTLRTKMHYFYWMKDVGVSMCAVYNRNKAQPHKDFTKTFGPLSKLTVRIKMAWAFRCLRKMKLMLGEAGL